MPLILADLITVKKILVHPQKRRMHNRPKLASGDISVSNSAYEPCKVYFYRQ